LRKERKHAKGEEKKRGKNERGKTLSMKGDKEKEKPEKGPISGGGEEAGGG